MAKNVKRSVMPIYLVGLTWLGYAMLFPLRRPKDFLLCAALSAVAFIIGKAVFPDKTYTVPGEEKQEGARKKEAEKPKTTGNPEIDALIKERDRALSEMRRLNDAIEDARISEQIDHLEQTTAKIIGHVVDNPKKLPQIRRFMSYYLPTTLKLLNAYDRMDCAGVAGDNISSTKERVEKMMDTLVQAYDKQFDALFGDEAMDISTDITVLENLLRQEGFASGEKTKSEDGSITLEL